MKKLIYVFLFLMLLGALITGVLDAMKEVHVKPKYYKPVEVYTPLYMEGKGPNDTFTWTPQEGDEGWARWSTPNVHKDTLKEI